MVSPDFSNGTNAWFTATCDTKWKPILGDDEAHQASDDLRKTLGSIILDDNILDKTLNILRENQITSMDELIMKWLTLTHPIASMIEWGIGRITSKKLNVLVSNIVSDRVRRSWRGDDETMDSKKRTSAARYSDNKLVQLMIDAGVNDRDLIVKTLGILNDKGITGANAHELFYVTKDDMREWGIVWGVRHKLMRFIDSHR